MSEKEIKAEMIDVGKRLYNKGLAVSKSGNISARLEDDTILITATGSYLGDLGEDDIVKVKVSDGSCSCSKKPSSELPLHLLVYKNFTVSRVIHCHPPLINAYFAAYPSLKSFTFESRLYLGEVSAVDQDTPSVTKPEFVIAALKNNNQAVLKNHGSISIGNSFLDALGLVETLEESVRTAAVARLFKKEILDDMDVALKDVLLPNECVYTMFSKEHIQEIVDRVNKDAFISQKGAELNLTVQLAIKMDNFPDVYKFNFEQGKITRLDFDENAPFVISAPENVWEQVFLGKLDSFVAVTQGKMKLSGSFGQLSKWYVPFTRLFGIFREVKIKVNV